MFDLRQLKLMTVVRTLGYGSLCLIGVVALLSFNRQRAARPTPVIDAQSIDELRVELIKATVRAAYWEGYEDGYHAHSELLGVPEHRLDKVWP